MELKTKDDAFVDLSFISLHLLIINNKLHSKLEERLINMASGAQRAGADISISASKHKHDELQGRYISFD